MKAWGRRFMSPERERFEMAMTRGERLAQMRRMAVQLEVADDPVEMVTLSRALLVAAGEYRDLAFRRENAHNVIVTPHPVPPTADSGLHPPKA